MAKTYSIAREDGKLFAHTKCMPDIGGIEYVFVDKGSHQVAEYARKDVATEDAENMPFNCTVVHF